MKEVYAYQEVIDEIAQGEQVSFTMHPNLHVTAVRKNLNEQAIIATLTICVGEYAIGEFTMEFSSMETLLAAFDIADHEEIFEVLGEP
ncbi:MAG: hypothetical protein ACRDIV_13935 [Ktedonobacteraceae bacterium]